MKNIMALLIFTLLSSMTAFAHGPAEKTKKSSKVYIISPADGAVVNSEFKVQFGLTGMGVAPAGFNKANTGHHHILINKDAAELDLTQPLPATVQVKHFGGGQTETLLKLPKGKHTLQLVLGDFAHRPHSQPLVSKKITIIVK